MTQKMRIAIGQANVPTDEYLAFARQLGLGGVQLNTPSLPSEDGFWRTSDLRSLKQRVESYGLRLEAIENVPLPFYQKAIFGLPERDQQIEKYQETIRNMGEAGIPILGYHWMPNGVWRTPNAKGRGGATVTAFDLNNMESGGLVHGLKDLSGIIGSRIYSEETMWENYLYFMRAILPTAEKAGVKLALHPDDPPVPKLGGIPRLFYRLEGFTRAMKDAASPSHGLDFCMGCFSSMGEDVIAAMRYFGQRGKLFYVHFRDVKGRVPCFEECFLGEGNINVVEAVITLKKVGFTGFLIDDHVPHMVNDSDWNHRGHAQSTGYMVALLDAVNYFVR